jgi:hypothetical protein
VSRPLEVLEAEIRRADASAQATASAWKHSLRDERGKEQQRATAELAQARATGMRETRDAVAGLVLVARAVLADMESVAPKYRAQESIDALRASLAPFND